MSANVQAQVVSDSQTLGSITMSPNTGIVAGSRDTWTFEYTVGNAGIAVGGSIRIWTPQHHSYRLRYFEWDLQQLDCWIEGDTAGDTAGNTDGKTKLTVAVSNSGLQRYPAICVFVAGAPLQPRQKVTILVGDTLAGGDRARAQVLAWDDMIWQTEVDTEGNGDYAPLAESPIIDVLPAAPASLVVVAPPTPTQGQAFPLIVRVEDEFTNICKDYAGVVKLTCTDGSAELPQEITFSQADNGIIELTDCVLHSTGIHTISAKAMTPALAATSNPMQVIEATAGNEQPYHIYFGDLHAQSGYHIRDLRFGNNLDLFNYARHVQGLNFVACTDLVSRFGESEEKAAWWPRKLAETEAAYVPGEFVAIQSYEWNSSITGHRNVLFPGSEMKMYEYRYGTDKPVDDMWGMPDPALNTPDDLQAAIAGTGAITIPHHTNSDNDYSAEDLPRARRKHNWTPHDWSYGPYENEMLIEMHQGRGGFETDTLSKWVLLGGFGSSVQDGLRLGRRLGFVGGSDSHIGRTSPAISFFTVGKRGGLTGVYAETLTREDIFAALRARRTYATDGVRMLIRFEVNDTLMGGEIDLASPTTARVIHAHAVGTRPIERMEVIRNNEVVYTHEGSLPTEEFTWTDEAPCADGTFYYLRVIQETDGIGWASPVWINLE